MKQGCAFRRNCSDEELDADQNRTDSSTVCVHMGLILSVRADSVRSIRNASKRLLGCFALHVVWHHRCVRRTIFFVTWAWKWSWVAHLMHRSVVHGVWAGNLQSDFKNEGNSGVDLPIIFVIRQTYLTLSVRSLTQRQRGTSSLEVLVHDEKTQDTHLSYVFKLDQPWVPRGKYGYGAGELQLEAGGTILRGVYWTDSPTHGTLRLKHVSTDVEGISCFEDAEQKFPGIWKARSP